MLEGLNSAAAGMAAQQARLDAVSHDLANVNTNGYKQHRVAFRDLVYQQANRPADREVRTGAGSAAMDGGRAMTQGAVRQTGQPLDVAIQGEGFLQVRLPDGRTGLTRDGALRTDGAGRLVTSTGALVQPAITLPEGVSPGKVKIGTDGTLTADGRALGRLQLVTVRAPQALESVGDTAFVATAASGAATPAPRATLLSQGALEGANVDVADTMVSVIEAQRAFELASKAIQTADQMMEIANGVKRG
jgi:flagellar basal-body rod protein FlgG